MDGEQTHGLDPRASPAAGAVAALLRTALGANLEAVYVHGSAVLGGYLPAVSDLDMLAVSGGPLSDTEIDAICSGLAGLSLPAKGLEMSVLTRAEAASPDLERPRYQVHVALASDGKLRRVDGRSGAGDRDLVLHLAVCRAAGHAAIGLPPASTLGTIPPAAIRGAMAGEIAWASEAGRLAYLVLVAARARTFARTGRLVSKVEAAEAELDGSADEPVVRAALAQQLGDAASIDPMAARRYAAEVARELRADTPGR